MSARSLLLSILMAAVYPHVAFAAPSAANIVSIQGTGQFKPGDRADWAAARIEQDLFAGHFVRTGEYSRMGLLFRDQTQLRLNEKTVLQLKEAGTDTRVRLDLGHAWAQSKTLPQKLYMETPSATAAIRGTDWDLEVYEDGRSVLTVLSGEVEFFNDLGRLVLKRDESAEARVGLPPTRLIFVRPGDRVQWVTSHAIVPLHQISLAGRPVAAEPGSDPIGAGFAALRRGDVKEARSRFDSAGKLHGMEAELLALGRASISILDRDLARAFAELIAVVREYHPTQPAPFLLLADLAVFAGDFAQAETYLRQGLERFPGDTRLHGALARNYLLADQRDKSREEIATVRKLHGQTLEVALAEGELARIEGDVRTAKQAFELAIAARPADDRGWFGLGRVNTEKEEVHDGRSNLLKALELNPQGAGYRGELGTLESFANDFSAARAAFVAGLALNPDDYIALTGLGLLELKRGNTDLAFDAFLRAGLMERRYARAHVYTAVAYYQTRRVQQALDELDRASQLDEKDPLPHFLASIIHSDSLLPGAAIEQARKALQLLPYLKSLNQLANDQQGLTNLGQAFAFLGMEEWAQRYAQDSYYPFWAGSHLFLADRYAGLFTKNSELFQGLLADPTVFGGGSGFQTLVPKPGNNASVSMRVTSAGDQVHGTSPKLQASGFSNATLPLAYFADHERFSLDFKTGPLDQRVSTLAFGVAPRHDVGVFVFADRTDLDSVMQDVFYNLRQKLRSDRADIGFHYKFSPNSQLWIKAGIFDSKDDTRGGIAYIPAVSNVLVHQPEWGLRQTFDAGDGHQITWGAEQGDRRTTSDLYDTSLLSYGIVTDLNYRYRERSQDFFLSDHWRASPNLTLQGDLFYQDHRRTAEYANYLLLDAVPLLDPEVTRQEFSRSRLNPRLGLVYRFANGPQARVVYQRWLRPAIFSSLGPIATVGIPLDDRMVMRGGELTRVRSQLEWETSSNTFLAAHLDFREINNNRFSLTPFALNELESLGKLRPRRLGTLANDDMLEFVNTPEYDGGRIRSAGIAFNHLLGEQWGVFGRYVGNSSINTGTAQAGKQVPLMPRRISAVGATWASPGGWYFTSRLVHRSERFKDEANLAPLEPGWSGALDLYWQSPNKTWLLRFSADDALDRNKPTQYVAEINIRF